MYRFVAVVVLQNIGQVVGKGGLDDAVVELVVRVVGRVVQIVVKVVGRQFGGVVLRRFPNPVAPRVGTREEIGGQPASFQFGMEFFDHRAPLFKGNAQPQRFVGGGIAGDDLVVSLCAEQIFNQVGLQLGTLVGGVELLLVFAVVGYAPKAAHHFDVVLLVEVHDLEVGLHVLAVPVVGADGQFVAGIVFVEPVANDGEPHQRGPDGQDTFRGGCPQLIVPGLEGVAVAFTGKSPLVVSESLPRGGELLLDGRFEGLQVCRYNPCCDGKSNKNGCSFHMI